MEENALNIQTPIAFDDAISHYEFHAHQPYGTSSFANSDEIRITVQNQDLYTRPCKSYVHIIGKLTKPNGAPVEGTRFVNLGVNHLFEEIRYEINGIEVDKVKNVGITTVMKTLISLNSNQTVMTENAGWLKVEETSDLADAAGNFDVTVPLSSLLGFAEDYQKIIANVKHELILIRSRTDTNAIIQTAPVENAQLEEYKIVIHKIDWLVPYVTLSDQRKAHFLGIIEKDPGISMGFRSWDLYEYPMLPPTTKHIWTVKTATQLEKPRYVIVGLQTNRRNESQHNSSRFDHCDITDVKLYLNSVSYPYGSLNIDIDQHQYALLYNMYTNFQISYYGYAGKPVMRKPVFINQAPLIVIDCSKQNESLKVGPVDVRLELQAKNNFPANTTAYCLILHDRIVEYHPISGRVRKIP